MIVIDVVVVFFFFFLPFDSMDYTENNRNHFYKSAPLLWLPILGSCVYFIFALAKQYILFCTRLKIDKCCVRRNKNKNE